MYYYKVFKDDNYDEFMDNYPLLFRQKSSSMTKTCMCWGICCPIGWKRVLEHLCNDLELINLTLGKEYGFQIQASQVKEKFGTLRFYYDIVPGDSFRMNLYNGMSNFLTKFREKFLKKNPNYTYFGEEPYYVDSFFSKVEEVLSKMIGQLYPTIVDKKIVEYVQSKVDRLIADAEEATANICADCGETLTKDNKVETKGWITYLCKDCDKERKKKDQKIVEELEKKSKNIEKVVEKTDKFVAEKMNDIVDTENSAKNSKPKFNS